jgi:hypothetical protein
MSSLANVFSGGADTAASNDLNAALENLQQVASPSAEQLTLPQLQQYVQAGIITPEQAQAYLVSSNAFDNTTADNSGLDTELSTIGELQDIVNQGGNDAEEKSDIQNILNTLGTTESGDNAAILRDAAARGVSNSGTTMAARLASNQNDATNANTNAMTAAANAEARQLAALNSKGSLGSAVQGQEYAQDTNKANAADAIATFNAQQKEQVGNLNTTSANEAQKENVANAQDISNRNTASSQTQQESVIAAQQQAYEDALQKASASAADSENLANQATQVGQQNSGILGGLIGAAGTVAASEMSSSPITNGSLDNGATSTVPNANVSNNASAGAAVATGGRITPKGVERPINMKDEGGPVPGQAVVPGDSPRNDNVRADLSPDEIVLPRTVSIPAMNGDMSKVMQFLKSLPKPQARPSIHPKAVLDTLRALSAHHSGAPV